MKKERLQPSAFVVFGATGDLTQKKLYPALYEMALQDALPEKLYIYGIAREEHSDDGLRAQIREAVTEAWPQPDKKVLARLLKQVTYIAADLEEREGYERLEADVKKHEKRAGKPILRIFYLALPPGIFPHVARNVESCRLGKSLCSKKQVLSRIIIEKPFGHDLASAKKLDKRLKEVFKEEQVYRIDHYLGKEAFQNIMMFRFGNALFDEHWDRDHISQIQINALESIGTEGRFAYYDGAGATRDMIQSHLLQFLANVTMDEPKKVGVEALREAKLGVLKHVRPYVGKVRQVRGQYRGYRSEKGVKKGSKTETYAAMKLEINSPRWKGVPVYIRTGKHLDRKETSAVIEFRHRGCCFIGDPEYPLKKNRIALSIAPVSAVSMRVNVHHPGTDFGADDAAMHYCRSEQYGGRPPLGDYARLLIDVIRGDRTLFTGPEEVFASWKLVDRFMGAAKGAPEPYRKGSRGPAGAEAMPEKDGHAWLDPLLDCPAEQK